MIAPLRTLLISPLYSSNLRNSVFTIPVPLVKLMMNVLNPKSPQVGTSKLTLYLPSGRSSTYSRIPCQFCITSITVLTCSRSSSILHFSIGSVVLPYSFFTVTTSGGEIDISNPSLLIFSTKIPRCKSPLPLNFILSYEAFSS